MTSSSLADKLRNMDAHSAVSNEFRVRTGFGAFLSLTTLVAIFYLVRSELEYNLTPTVLDHVQVKPTTPDGLEMEFDVTFPNLPCALLSIDANDPTGQPQSLHLDRSHRVWKNRLDKDGELIGRKSRFELGGTFKSEENLYTMAEEKGIKVPAEDKRKLAERDSGDSKDDEEECGSCYGAGEDGECCNTCDDVKRAYQRRGWHLDDLNKVTQCRHSTKSTDEKNEGCNVHGVVALGTGGGNLHIAPGHQLEKFGEETGGFLSIAEFIMETFEQFNVTHTLHKVRFGPEIPGQANQLDGAERTIADGYGMYQYYIQIVPTKYTFLNGTVIETNQYSVTEHMRHVNPGSGRGVPGVFFFYEVSALHVEFEEYRRGWIHFFTGVCAVVGGVFTIAGMTDKFVHHATRSRGKDSYLG